ncbi:MAG: SDR family NAD(P)-dependent oxidoreductase [Massilia sp.]
MDLQLAGKTALVTGSCAGIGFAIARRLAAEGAEVVVCGREQDNPDQAAEKIAAFGKVRAIHANPGTVEGAKILIEAVPEVDILVNNLGIYEFKNFTDITDEDLHRFYEVNVVSGARLSRHYFPKMLAKGWGRIIFTSSEAALVVPGDMIHYASSKAAQLAMARGLAELTRGTAVTVNSLIVGGVRSDNAIAALCAAAQTTDAAEAERQFFTAMRPLSLIQRLIDPEEIAAQAALLASPLGAPTNGAAIRLDGGTVPTPA